MALPMLLSKVRPSWNPARTEPEPDRPVTLSNDSAGVTDLFVDIIDQSVTYVVMRSVIEWTPLRTSMSTECNQIGIQKQVFTVDWCLFLFSSNSASPSPPSAVPGRLGESGQPAADPSVLWPGRVQRRAYGEAPGRLAEADPAGGGEAHRDGRARGLQQDLQHPLLWGVHHHEPRGHRPLAARWRDDRSLYTLCGGAAAGGMRRTSQGKFV